MSTAIVQKGPTAIDSLDSKLDLIKRTVAVGASNDELEIFLHQCKKTGLDPLARQIYFVKRQGKGTIQTGIDGYRLVADRTGKYAGNDDPEFDDGEAIPKWAKVTVWKLVDGVRCPFSATARWSQYYPGDQQGWAWKKMPHLMLGKCAEALALRKAFPAELSGVYTFEEMEQASGHSATLSGACSKCGVEIPADETTCEGCGNPDKAKTRQLYELFVDTMDCMFSVDKKLGARVCEAITGVKTRAQLKAFHHSQLEPSYLILKILEVRIKNEGRPGNEADWLAQVEMAKEDYRTNAKDAKTLLQQKLEDSLKVTQADVQVIEKAPF